MSTPIDRIVVATHNRKKAGEMLDILEPALPTIEFLLLGDFEGAEEPEETGATYAENATIKAISAARLTRCVAIADDAGLEIDALKGAPGVHSKRFEGVDSSFPNKMDRILEMLKDLPGDRRSARFRCWVAIADPVPGTEVELFEGTCEGRIALAPSGQHGFGYDPIFELPSGRTMAQLTSQEKHGISHRGEVLRKVIGWLSTKVNAQ